MKLLLIILSIVGLNTTRSSFYEIKFEAVDGTLIKTSAYQGKKVVVAVVSANSANLQLVHYLDSVQKANSSVQVIAIPTGDFNGDISVQDLKTLKKTISILVAAPLKVKKSYASFQHPLFQWLTKAKENQHFDMDVEAEGQVFVVSATGTLYSVLSKDVPMDILGNIINQNVTE
jgi:glutathione peroxidase-family protein